MEIQQIINRKNITYLAFAALFFGLYYQRVVLSISMISIGVIALLNWNLKNDFLQFLKRPDLLFITGIFFLYGLSGLYSENTDRFLELMRVKLPFVFLPLSFLTLPSYKANELRAILALFVLLTFSSIFFPLNAFLSDPEKYAELYKAGRVIPTPIHHIRYSILLSIAHFIALWLGRKYFQNQQRAKAWLFTILGIVFFIFLHLLSVRSGLLGLYLAWGFILFFGWKQKWIYKLSAAIFLGIAIFSAFQLSPTLKAKWGYMMYDLKKMTSGEKRSDYSDSGRIISIIAGWETGKKSPIIGVGAGDIKAAMQPVYEEKYPFIDEDRRIRPHNQFVSIFVGMGIIGFIYFSISIFLPVFYRQRYKFTLFAALQLILISSLLFESSLEVQYGTAIYLFFTLFFIRYHKALSGKE